jgi:hypothetical protein
MMMMIITGAHCDGGFVSAGLFSSSSSSMPVRCSYIWLVALLCAHLSFHPLSIRFLRSFLTVFFFSFLSFY